MKGVFDSFTEGTKMGADFVPKCSEFWRMFDEGQNSEILKTKFKISSRSRYTHHRKSKMSKEEKKKVIKE